MEHNKEVCPVQARRHAAAGADGGVLNNTVPSQRTQATMMVGR